MLCPLIEDAGTRPLHGHAVFEPLPLVHVSSGESGAPGGRRVDAVDGRWLELLHQPVHRVRVRTASLVHASSRLHAAQYAFSFLLYKNSVCEFESALHFCGFQAAAYTHDFAGTNFA